MVQNPHHYPWCHAPSLASRSLTGVTLSHWCRAARRGADKFRKGVAGNGGGVTGDQLRDGACVR